MGAADHPLGPLAPLAAHNQFVVALRATKAPLNPRTAMPANSHDSANWCSYGEAARTVATWGPDHFGVGFVLTAADDVGVIDIDDALLPDGTWKPHALDICRRMPGAVVELSQSGRGLHVWFRSPAMPEHSKKNTALRIECYSEARYILLGSSSAGTLASECPGALDVIAEYFPPRGALATISEDDPVPEWKGPQDDGELIHRALKSRSARSAFGGGASFADLWHRNVEALARAYPPDESSSDPFDESSADMALACLLAFWTGRSVARVARLMRQSALVREKWDENAKYLVETTIKKACAQQRDVYRGREATTVWQPQGSEAIQEARDFGITDPLSAVKRFVAERYAHAEGSLLRTWQGSSYRWRDARWLEVSEADVKADLYDFLDRQPGSDHRPDQSRVNKMLDALRHAPRVHLDSQLMPPCWITGAPIAPAGEIVACANGMLHLPSRSLIAPTPRFFNMAAVPFAYNPQAPAPGQWLRFLATVWPDDPEAIATLQELFGYLLTPDTSQQKIFLIVGPKRSGKGTIARVLTEMLGAENVAGPTLASMATPFGLQPLVGTLAAIISDARLSGRTDQKEVAENLLRISGEDRIEIGRKFLPSLTMRLATRFVLLTNELPRIADASGAMASRFVILTMRESFIGREDPGLTARLLTELPGVLAWAVDGWHRLTGRGYFVEPKSSAGAAQELADLGSPISAFVRDECECAPEAEIEMGAMFTQWRDWCVRQGLAHSGSAQTFGRDLRAAFPSITQARPRAGGERVRVYRGVRMRGPRGPQTAPLLSHTAPTYR